MENPLSSWLDKIVLGNCLEVMPTLPAESVDLIFADPPYNLQLSAELWRPNNTKVNGVNEAWDKFENLNAYDEFTKAWLTECRRVLKPTGTLWVIGSYHNIYRVGGILQDLGYWILNDIVWVKSNPMPNFCGVRFTNAHETLIWAQKTMGAKYTFNYHAMKALNDDLQMRSDWFIPLCTGTERLKEDGHKVHPTQKPEALLYRILLATTNPGDVVLDPFFGTGTTGAMAKKLQRHFIGIEVEPNYVRSAQKRLSKYMQLEFNAPLYITPNPRNLERIPFGALVEQGFIEPGQALFFGREGEIKATVQADGSLICNGQRGSIHQLARSLRNGPANGWSLWYYWDSETQSRQPIDQIRKNYRDKIKKQHSEI
ncbi:MAG: site-specific DNA-methyltransferase [Anaerolineaceae bacterium]